MNEIEKANNMSEIADNIVKIVQAAKAQLAPSVVNLYNSVYIFFSSDSKSIFPPIGDTIVEITE